MEDNVADALKMAGSVLLFVLGLSIVFLAYSNARQSIDTVLSYSDRESLTIDNNSRYYYLLDTGKTSRNVGAETVIPAIYRSYNENYKIIFDFSEVVPNYYLYKDKNGYDVKEIDLKGQSLLDPTVIDEFLDGIVYGKFINNSKQDYIAKFSSNLTAVNNISLFEMLSDDNYKYKIEEKLGTYYMEDLDYIKSQNPEANKTEKRVITYIFH